MNVQRDIKAIFTRAVEIEDGPKVFTASQEKELTLITTRLVEAMDQLGLTIVPVTEEQLEIK